MEVPKSQASYANTPKVGSTTTLSPMCFGANEPQSRQSSRVCFRAKAQRMGRQQVTCQVRLIWRGALAKFLLQLCVVAFVFLLGGAPPPQ